MLAGGQVRQRGLHQEHRSAHIDVERLAQRLGGVAAHRLSHGVSSRVDHDVDTAVLVDRGSHQGVDIIQFSHVGGHTQRPIPLVVQFLRRGGTGIGFAARHHHRCPTGTECLSDRVADSPGTPGDDGRAPGQVVERLEVSEVHARHSIRLTSPGRLER
ncbi:Uncharacterised protein [Mycobacteroides abscessus subsp. abscessus]|nr:Uncharacterised protein [Mycobacteroides abscessus subsp. abscessus]